MCLIYLLFLYCCSPIHRTAASSSFGCCFLSYGHKYTIFVINWNCAGTANCNCVDWETLYTISPYRVLNNIKLNKMFRRMELAVEFPSFFFFLSVNPAIFWHRFGVACHLCNQYFPPNIVCIIIILSLYFFWQYCEYFWYVLYLHLLPFCIFFIFWESFQGRGHLPPFECFHLSQRCNSRMVHKALGHGTKWLVNVLAKMPLFMGRDIYKMQDNTFWF